MTAQRRVVAQVLVGEHFHLTAEQDPAEILEVVRMPDPIGIHEAECASLDPTAT